ncbi:hypothetical protein [Paenibacillus peoriae]|uniref:hypothetical protein n=1 Tax=Paenibacillus peoriae TaxID=59893 RepID=UPI001CC1C6D0|nr:hypothetical protein [Paenibacillus peoriae]
MKKSPYFKCLLPIFSEESLIVVAQIISDKLFWGVPFIGLEDHIYDEVPAVYIDNPILGIQKV